jgi:hypothetical protein
MCSVWVSVQTAIISLFKINWLVFITEAESVYCAVWAGSSHQTDTKFYIQLTVHHVMILGKWPKWRTIFYCVFIFIFISILTLYMFRAHRALHQERQIVSTQPLVTVALCRWPCRVQVGSELPYSASIKSGLRGVRSQSVQCMAAYRVWRYQIL